MCDPSRVGLPARDFVHHILEQVMELILLVDVGLSFGCHCLGGEGLLGTILLQHAAIIYFYN